MSSQIQVGDPKTEWKRSNPDIIVYIPEEDGINDGDNEHFLVFESPDGEELLAMWNQSSCEGRGDNHIVIARSKDGENWSKPQWIAGTHPGTDEPQASWGFPVVSKQGRIYCFYVRELNVYDNSRQASGAMGCHYSDDQGHTWIQGKNILMKRNRYDNPDPSIPRNWIVWQKPIRDSQGRWFVGYSQDTSNSMMKYTPAGWWENELRCQFMRFDNIDDAPDPTDIKITWLPYDEEGLTVPHPYLPDVTIANEPSVVLLPDNRIFTTIRNATGHIWYSMSEDDGETWRKTEVMRYKDNGEPVKEPIAPCPIYALNDGRYLLVFHNNDGRFGPYNQFERKWKTNYANHFRRPGFIAVGEFRPEAHQPIWFSQPKQILDTDGVIVGPKRTAEIATYTSLTEWKGKRVLWYPDRKYYLLGKYITDDMLDDMVVDRS
ncbi:hypothetical protein GF312_02855 [Candidatus Poribacteria bacterium]|nr:hypothetical protein [Candidatus Poribacteria bacterium]